MPSPAVAYRSALAAGFQPDPGQAAAVNALEQCYQALQQGKSPRGLYLWGPVGRGKTWLMDLFHHNLPVPARRQHFHHFMRWIHQRLHQLHRQANPLQQLAAELAASVRVLCLDELYVSDIGDAMLLGGLFQALFEQPLTLVVTSNQPPSALYAGGFNYDRFAPAVAALQQHLQLVAVDGDADHRLHPTARLQRYWVDDEAGFIEAFRQRGGTPAAPTALTLGGRQLPVQQCRGDQLWCDFNALCEAPWAAQDYIQLCDDWAGIWLSALPALGGTPQPMRIARGTEDGAQRVAAGDRQLPALAPRDDSVRRFIALVDECYDRGRPLYLSASVPLPQLYNDGHLTFAFRRTLSRLLAMQRADYGE